MARFNHTEEFRAEGTARHGSSLPSGHSALRLLRRPLSAPTSGGHSPRTRPRRLRNPAIAGLRDGGFGLGRVLVARADVGIEAVHGLQVEDGVFDIDDGLLLAHHVLYDKALDWLLSGRQIGIASCRERRCQKV